jgi:hypothetical protein
MLRFEVSNTIGGSRSAAVYFVLYTELMRIFVRYPHGTLSPLLMTTV